MRARFYVLEADRPKPRAQGAPTHVSLLPRIWYTANFISACDLGFAMATPGVSLMDIDPFLSFANCRNGRPTPPTQPPHPSPVAAKYDAGPRRPTGRISQRRGREVDPNKPLRDEDDGAERYLAGGVGEWRLNSPTAADSEKPHNP